MIYARSGRDESEPLGRYRHELAFDGRLIYVFGGGTSTEVFGFSVRQHLYYTKKKK